MASIASCPESEKKKLSNVFSNATAEMLESNYSIKVLPHMKDYRVVIQDFRYEKAMIGASKVSEDSKFIFYNPDPKNKRDQYKNIILYDREGKIIESIKVKHISDIAYCKKLKIAKDKAYEEKAIPAKYSKDILETEWGSFSKDNKFILYKKNSKAHHIKGYASTYDKYHTAIAEFIGITLFNAVLKKMGLYKDTTEYTIAKDESGKFYFDSTDARDDKSWKYIEYRKFIRDDKGLIQDIEHSKCIDFNLLKSITIASVLGSRDLCLDSDLEEDYIMTFNVLQFIGDENTYHTKYIDLNFVMITIMGGCFFNFKDNIIRSWYCGYLCNKEKFISSECKEAIFDAFRSIIEIDFIGELKAIEPILELASDSYDIAEILEKISSNISNMCKQIKGLATMKVDPFYEKEWQEFCENTNFNAEVVKLAEELKDKYDEKQAVYRETDLFVYAREWMDFCENTNCNTEIPKLTEELNSKHMEKQATYLAAATGSETMDTTSLEMYYEQGSQQI